MVPFASLIVFPFKSYGSLSSRGHCLSTSPYKIIFSNFLDAVESKFDEDSEAIFTCPVFVVPGATVQWSRESGDSLPSGAHQEADKLV